MMLERTPGPWILPADGNEAGDVMPTLTGTNFGGGPCIRDQYVAAAALNAYVAEANYRQMLTSAANGYANAMITNLRYAYALCSSSPVAGQGSSCATLYYVTCTDLATMLT